MKKVKLNRSEPCVNWMREFMQASGKPAAEVIEAGKSRGYSDSELRLAKKELEIKSVKQTVPGPWFWYKPKQLGDKPQGTAKTEDVAGISQQVEKQSGNNGVLSMTTVVGNGPGLPPAGKSKNNSDKSGINSEGGFDWFTAALVAAVAGLIGFGLFLATSGQIKPK